MDYQVIQRTIGSKQWHSAGEEYRHLSEFKADCHVEGLNLLDPATEYEAVPDDGKHQYKTILEEVEQTVTSFEKQATRKEKI